MTKLDPIIAVKDVEASANWYHQVFGFKRLHGGNNFEVLATEANEIILCLHKWGEHHHPSLIDQSILAGNGLLFYFRTQNLQAIRQRIDEVGGTLLEDVHINPNSKKKEFSIRDPDGYFLTVTDFHTYEG